MGKSEFFVHITEALHRLSVEEKKNLSVCFYTFYKAIHERKLINITYCEYGNQYTRKCVPFDYGIFRKYPYKTCFHGVTVGVEGGDYNLHILPQNVLKVKILDETFNPAKYVTWSKPYKWRIPRDWGEFS